MGFGHWGLRAPIWIMQPWAQGLLHHPCSAFSKLSSSLPSHVFPAPYALDVSDWAFLVFLHDRGRWPRVPSSFPHLNLYFTSFSPFYLKGNTTPLPHVPCSSFIE